MQRHIEHWNSPALGKHMEIVSYGHYGRALLLFPTAAADYLEYERFQLIDSIAHIIESGKFKVFSINSINNESWLNNRMHPRHKAIRHTQFNNYVYNEVVPYIRAKTSPTTPIITAGASFGALHAANLYLKHPWHIQGCIAMSGDYDLSSYTRDYWDEDVYFNSPLHYMENLTDHDTLNQIRSNGNLHLITGSGDWERPEATRRFAALLQSKGLPVQLDVWGHDIPHDWPSWRKMLPYLLEHKF